MMKRVLFVLLAGLVVLAGCGGGSGDSGGSNAHINEQSGAVNGAVPDERVGTKPPPAKKTGLAEAVEAAHCYTRLRIPPEEDKVISTNAPAPEYKRDPPISGPHVAPPDQQADGAYMTLPEEKFTVASIDHGRMTIQYAPDLPEEFQLELKGLYDTMYGGTLFFPNDSMNFAVTATTWTNGLYCTDWEHAATLDAIRAFGKATWGKFGDEPVGKFPVEGPTPAKPEESASAANG
jgi:Protein of unknown function (DUF3105)